MVAVDVFPDVPTESMPRLEGGVLFACLPAAGLINPLIAVAEELAARGGAPIGFASTEERRADLGRLGGEERPLPFVSLGTFHDGWPDIFSDEQLRSMSQGGRLRTLASFLDLNIDFDYDARQYERMLEVLDTVKPRLLVADLNTTWAMDAAMTRGIPFVASMPMPASSVYLDRLPGDYPTPFSGLPRRMNVRQRGYNALFRLGFKLMLVRPGRFGATVAAMQRRKKLGLKNPTGVGSGYADAALAILGYSTFDLEYDFPAVPEHLEMVGSMVAADVAPVPPGSELGDWLDRHESVVYLGLGTIMHLSRGQIDAVLEVCARLAPSGHAVLWKLSRSQQALLPPPEYLPANLRIEEWVPSQPAVLAHPHVKVFFNHGGGNAVHEALHCAKPLLVMPFWMDCYDLATRVVDRGVGLSVPNVDRPDPVEIAGKLERILSEEAFTMRAGELGARLRAAGGAAAAADVVESCLAGLRAGES